MSEVIEKITISETEDRFIVLKKIGLNAAVFENAIFHYANSRLSDYSHGYWKFGETSNGGWFMIPPIHELVNAMPIEIPAYNTRRTASATACGIALTMLVIGHMLSKAYEDNMLDSPLANELSRNYNALYKAVSYSDLSSEDKSVIYAVID